MGDNRVIRITPKPGEQKININLEQDFDFLEVLSLRITQKEAYRIFCSSYGVLVGKVVANGGFPIQNAKLSIFIPIDEEDLDNKAITDIYPFSSPYDTLVSGKRYNLLPRDVQPETPADHTPVGTFPSKYDIMTNKTLKYVHEKYYKYTTTTNENGDYMFFGVPGGTQIIHLDVDLSDIGSNSVIPQDLINLGYSEGLFAGPDKFRGSNDLDQLAQIVGINNTAFIRPFWGDVDECEFGITRLDFNTSRFISPKAFLVGSVYTDADPKQENAAFVPRSCWSTSVNSSNVNGNKAGVSRIVHAKELRTPLEVQQSGEDFGHRGIIEAVRVMDSGQVEYVGKWESKQDGTFMIALPLNRGKKSWDENTQAFIDDEDGFPTYADYRFMFYFEGQGPDDFQADKIISENNVFQASAHGTNLNNAMWAALQSSYTDDWYQVQYGYKGENGAKVNRGIIYAPNQYIDPVSSDNEDEHNRYTFYAKPELPYDVGIPQFNMTDQFNNNLKYYTNYARIRLSGYYTTGQFFNLVGDYDVATQGTMPVGYEAQGTVGEWWNGTGDIIHGDTGPDWFDNSIGTNPWIISRTEISANSKKRQFPTNYIFDKYSRKDPSRIGSHLQDDGSGGISREVVNNVLTKGGFVSNYIMTDHKVQAVWHGVIPTKVPDVHGGCANGTSTGFNATGANNWFNENVTGLGLRDTPLSTLSYAGNYQGDNCECSGFPDGASTTTPGNCHYQLICGEGYNGGVPYLGDPDSISATLDPSGNPAGSPAGEELDGCFMKVFGINGGWPSYTSCYFGVYGQNLSRQVYGYNHFDLIGTDLGGTNSPNGGGSTQGNQQSALDGCIGCINFGGTMTSTAPMRVQGQGAALFNQNASPYGFSNDWSDIDSVATDYDKYGYGLGNIVEDTIGLTAYNPSKSKIAPGNNCILGNSMKGGFVAPKWGVYTFKGRYNYTGAYDTRWVAVGIHYCDTTLKNCDLDSNWSYSAATTNFGYTPYFSKTSGFVAFAGYGTDRDGGTLDYSVNWCPSEILSQGTEMTNSHCVKLRKNYYSYPTSHHGNLGVASAGYDSAGGKLSWNLMLKEGMAIRTGMVPANDGTTGGSTLSPANTCTTSPCGNFGWLGIMSSGQDSSKTSWVYGTSHRYASFGVYQYGTREDIRGRSRMGIGLEEGQPNKGEALHGSLYFPQYFIGNDEDDCCSRSNHDWEDYARQSMSQKHKARLWENYSLIYAGSWKEAALGTSATDVVQPGAPSISLYTANYGDPDGGRPIRNGRYYNVRTIGSTTIVDITKEYPSFRNGPNQWSSIDRKIPDTSVNINALYSYDYSLSKSDYERGTYTNALTGVNVGGIEYFQNKYFALYDNLQFRTAQQYPVETTIGNYTKLFPQISYMSSNPVSSWWDWLSSAWQSYGFSYPMASQFQVLPSPINNKSLSRYHVFRETANPSTGYNHPRWVAWMRMIPKGWYDDNTFWWRDIQQESVPDPTDPSGGTYTTPWYPVASTYDNNQGVGGTPYVDAWPLRKYYYFGISKDSPTALDRLKNTVPK
tara:strand:+ start:9011 stop:13603 length:4593 start_codon:yes stop_codon:yes gene_type:complete